MQSYVISHEDVVKHVYHFLEASGYKSTLLALQAESAIPYNVINEIEPGTPAPKKTKSTPRTAANFEQLIMRGDWATLLSKYISGLLLPKEMKGALYEIVLEEVLLLHGIPTAARVLLQNTPALVALKTDAPARYMRLENLINNFDVIDFQDRAAKGEARVATPEMVKKRETVLHMLLPVITFTDAPYDGLLPTALTTVLQEPTSVHGEQASHKRSRSELESQSGEGSRRWQDALLAYPIVAPKKILTKLVYEGDQSVTHCAVVHPNGADKVPQLLVGRTDGTLDFIAYKSSALTPLGTSVGHSSSVVHMSVEESDESTWVAIGYRDGSLKIYNVETHKLVRKFLTVHSLGITCIIFRGERLAEELQGHSPLLVTGSYDTQISLLHVGSGTVLFKVTDAHHGTYINALCPLVGTMTANCCLSGGNDGTLSLWRMKGETSLCRLGVPFTLHSLYAQLKDVVVTDLVALSSSSSSSSSSSPSSSARNEIVALTRSEKVIVFSIAVDEQNALSPMTHAEVLALIVAPKAIRSGVPYVRSTASQAVPVLCAYLTDIEGNILLYDVEMFWRSAEKRQQVNGVLRVTDPTDQSAAVIVDNGSAVTDMRTVTAWTSTSSPSVVAYGPPLSALYWLV